MNNRNINTKLNKTHSLYSLTQENLSNSFEIYSEGDLNASKIVEENLNDNLDTNLELSTKENRVIKINNVYNTYKIENYNFFIQGVQIFNKKDKNNKEIKKRGRKRKRNDNESDNNKTLKTHTKFTDDNLTKKSKNIILKYALKFINEKIEEIYQGDIGEGKFKKELKIISQKNKVKSTVNIDKSFLDKNLKDIFSENISGRFNNFPKTYNMTLIESLLNEEDEEKKSYFIELFNITFSTLIESLLNEEDEEKKSYFIELFNITFSDCLDYFMDNKNNNKKLEGFVKFSSIKESLIHHEGKNYIDAFIYFLKNFKDIINNKKSRRRNKDDKIND